MRVPDLTKGFIILVLLLSTGAFLPLLGQESGTANSAQGYLMAQVTWFVVYGITFLLIIVRWEQFIRVAMRDKFLLLLIGIVLLSVLWSAAPEITVRRSMALLGTTLFGIYVATCYDSKETLRLLAWSLGMAALFSLVFALTLPSYGVVTGTTVQYEGIEGWRGIYGEKNALGAAMALGAVVFLILALGKPRYRWVMWAYFGLLGGILLLSNANAALMSFLILLILFPLYKALRWQYTLTVPLFIIMMLVGGITTVWLVANTGSVLTALGRDVTLTGRTEIWPVVIESIRQRPWLGYGYGGFWLGWAGESAHVWLRTTLLFDEGGGPAHAHNGWLDLWINLGLLGVSVFALSFLRSFSKAVTWARSTKTVEGFWPLAYLTFMLLYTSVDFPIVNHNSIFWVLYVAVAFYIPGKDTSARNGSPSPAPVRKLRGRSSSRAG